jgi:hypothetical protein
MGRAAKAQKRQVKEVRTMLDRPDRSADDKLRLLNTKYLQQVYTAPSTVQRITHMVLKSHICCSLHRTVYQGSRET